MITEILTTALIACASFVSPPKNYMPNQTNPTPPSAEYIPLVDGVYYSKVWIGFPMGRNVSDGQEWYEVLRFVDTENENKYLKFNFAPSFQAFWDMMYLDTPSNLLRNHTQYKTLDGYIVFGDKWVYEIGTDSIGNIDVVLEFSKPLRLTNLDQDIQNFAQVSGKETSSIESYYETWFRGIPTSLDYQQGYQDGYQDGYDVGQTNGYTNGHNTGYDQGYNAGVADATSGEFLQFTWIKQVFNGMATFFNIQVLPNISLGFLMFAPLVVVAIVAIVRIIKHE